MRKWAAAVVMALNQLANAMLGGDPDMAVSARAGYARARGSTGGYLACTLLDWADVANDGDDPAGDHCDKAVANYERDRRNEPEPQEEPIPQEPEVRQDLPEPRVVPVVPEEPEARDGQARCQGGVHP